MNERRLPDPLIAFAHTFGDTFLDTSEFSGISPFELPRSWPAVAAADTAVVRRFPGFSMCVVDDRDSRCPAAGSEVTAVAHSVDALRLSRGPLKESE